MKLFQTKTLDKLNTETPFQYDARLSPADRTKAPTPPTETIFELEARLNPNPPRRP